MRRHLWKYCVLVVMLALCAGLGFLAANRTANAFAGAVTTLSSSTTTSTISTDTTTTGGNLAPPYDKPPQLNCGTSVTMPNQVHRSKVHSFYLDQYCRGLAKQASLQLGSLPKGSSFIGQGSREKTCAVTQTGGIVKCWQKQAYTLVDGKPTWQENNLTPRRDGRQVVWTVIVHIRLSHSSPLGWRCDTMTGQASNGDLTLGPDSRDKHTCYNIYK